MSRRVLKVTALMGVALAVTASSGACRTATQVELDVTYDGVCSDLQEVAFIIGTDPTVAEGRIETNVFTTTTTHCAPGSPSRVGTLVVTPNDATGRASIIVLASFGGQSVNDCKPEKGYAGCIVARRAFAFVDHTALTLEIPLEASCKSVPCDAVSTCRHASCVSSETTCTGSGCGDPGVAADGGVELSDAPTDPDAYVQGLDAQPPPSDGSMPSTDASLDGPTSMSDGSLDAPVDAPPDAAADRCYPQSPVTCSPDGQAGGSACPNTTDVCCRGNPVVNPLNGTFEPAPYTCHAGGLNCYTQMSQGAGTIVRCRSSRNCPTGQVCCLNTMNPMDMGESMCATTCQMGGIGAPSFPHACEGPCECPVGQTCTSMYTAADNIHYTTCGP